MSKTVTILLFCIILIARGMNAYAQDYEPPRPSFNMSDTNACKNILCTGKWIVDKSYLEDSAITGRIINNGNELGITLMHNNSMTNPSPLSILFRESEWFFYRNNSYKIVGQYIKYKAADNGIDLIVLERKDTTIYGTWDLSFHINHSAYDDTAHYFNGNGYNVRVRHISINKIKNKYEQSIDMVGNLSLVQNGVKMAHWEGQRTFFDAMSIISAPFLYDDESHIVWLHSDTSDKVSMDSKY